MTTLAHVSDLHATPVEVHRPLDFVGKRFFGWLSWRSKRRHVHRPEVLEALVSDLGAQRPDHVAVTGDLTNVATAEEFPQARVWLERLGRPEDVTAVPGNHDAYARIAPERSWALWADYLRSDGDVGEPRFPSVRVRGRIAIVGVSSALPTPLFLASGRVGAQQLERLEAALTALGRDGLCRVVLVHHPVNPEVVSWRRALHDAARLRGVLARAGAELVLHGHGHRTVFGALPGPGGEIPVVGVRSASDATERPDRRAQYHLYDIEPVAAGGFRIAARIRGYSAAGAFASEGERLLRTS